MLKQLYWCYNYYSRLFQQCIFYSTSDLPGNVLTSDDLRLLLEELVDVVILFYPLGLQLKVRTEILDSIQAQFSDPTLQLREVLKFWLTTADKPSWKTLTDALRSRSVGASHDQSASVLADNLKAKYCLLEDMQESKC